MVEESPASGLHLVEVDSQLHMGTDGADVDGARLVGVVRVLGVADGAGTVCSRSAGHWIVPPGAVDGARGGP